MPIRIWDPGLIRDGKIRIRDKKKPKSVRLKVQYKFIMLYYRYDRELFLLYQKYGPCRKPDCWTHRVCPHLL
jgi:hypothetical protein